MTEMTNPDSSVVTLKDLWQSNQAQTEKLTSAINGMETTLARLTGHLDSIDQRNLRADGVLADYENRLRSLERWRYALPASLVLGMGSAAAAIVAALQAVHK